MPTTITESGPFERLVNLHISEEEIDAGKSSAARRLSQELKLKGFRPGKAPTPVVEAAVGKARLRQETIEDLINPTLNKILTDEDIRPAVSPVLEDIDDVDGGVDVSVRVTLWPEIETPKYKDRKIEIESPEVTDGELDEQVKRMLEQFATVEEVDRPAGEGDFVSVDVSASKDGESVEEATASDLLYEVGSEMFIEGIDEHLLGKSAGDTVTFEGALPAGFGERAGEQVTFEITVQEVKERILPDFDDEWVEENTEYETVAELTEELKGRLADAKLQAVSRQFGDRVMSTLRDQLQVELPEALVRAEMDNHLHRFVHRLEENELTLDDYFQASGVDRNAFVEDLREQATLSIQNQLIFEAVAQAEGLEVTEEDMSNALSNLAARYDDPAGFIRAFQESGQELALASDILRNRAMDVILQSATPVDENGEPVDLKLTIESEQEQVVEGEIVEAEPVEGEIVEAEAEEEE
ncbi:MAG: trigger factor [Actinobacteria bacterium]|nr:MAG: trigger factor [Actinomycetota bacterium]